MRILVVDDETDIVAEMGRFLRRRGHDVMGAHDVGAALRALAGDGPFDVVLTDLRMPDGSGLEVVRACAAGAAPRPTSLVMSGHAGSADVAELRAAGAADFFSKPVSLPSLLAVLASVAAARRPAADDPLAEAPRAARPGRTG